jgi:imidazolonepropionase-like amidohydrolase
MKHFKFISIYVLVIALFFIACTKTGILDSHPKHFALTNGILIDGTGAAPKKGAVVIIQNEYINSIETDSIFQIPAGVKVIDVDSAYILPGFMNTHVHGAYNENNLNKWAQAGVTTVRDLGNITSSIQYGFYLRDLFLMDNKNARLVAAGPLVTTEGGYGNYSVSSADDARNKINLLIDQGADLIKVAIEDNLQGRTWPMLSFNEIETIVQTAHSRNKRVAAHISRSKHLDLAIKAGVDDVNHMIVDYLPDSLITSMIEHDIYWIPTMELWDGVSDYHNINWDITAKNNLRRYVQAGGKVATGTDYDGYITEFQLGMPIKEMQLMQESGMTPMQIIVAGTKHAAYVCDLENALGTIEPGKIADIIVVEKNPLDDLSALSDVKMVIHNGEIIKDFITD